VAEKLNAERYDTHFSAFDLSAKPGFFFIRVSLVSKPLRRGVAEVYHLLPVKWNPTTEKQAKHLERGAVNDALRGA
jgi:hypothetical protein